MAGSGSGCRHEACAHWRAPQQMQSVNAYNKKVARACWRMMLLQTLSLRLTPKLAPESRQRQQQAANTLPKQMACHRCNSSSYSSSSSSSAALHPPAPTHRAVHAAPAHMALTRVKGGSRGRYPPPLMDWISHGITNWIYSDPDPFVSHVENMGPDS